MNIYKIIVRILLWSIFIFWGLECFLPASFSTWVHKYILFIIVLFIAVMECFGEKIIYMVASLFGKDIDGSKDYKGKHTR